MPPEPPLLPTVTVDPAAPVEVVVAEPPAPVLPVVTDPVVPELVEFFGVSEVEQLTNPTMRAPQSKIAVLGRARPQPALLDPMVRVSRRTDRWSFIGVTENLSRARQERMTTSA
jgi:hypothetical protein